MKKTSGRIEKFILPAYWASYLINDDESGLEGEDQYYADQFMARHNLPAPVSCSDESWFSRHNDSGNGLGGDVLEFTFLLD